MEVDLNGMKTYADFEFVEFFNDTDPYLTLLGIDWTFDNNIILNPKKQLMSFEKVGIWVV
jgi:hypothetical protein